MADAITSITIFHQAGITPATAAQGLIVDTSDRQAALMRASEKLQRIASGVEGATVLVRVDSATPAAATGSFTCVQASLTAGDKLRIIVPGYATPFTLTAVASGPTAASGEYSIETDNTAVGDSVVAAISAMPGLRDIITAVNATGTVTWTAKRAGLGGRGIYINKEVTTAAAHVITASVNGYDTSVQPTLSIVFGSANITAGDTISVGAREYTWAASASADGEITLSTTEATAATNFAAAINADATWTGLISASVDTATVTLTWLGDPRCGKHALVTTIAETNAGAVAPAGTVLVTGTEVGSVGSTLTGSSVTKRYVLGAGS